MDILENVFDQRFISYFFFAKSFNAQLNYFAKTYKSKFNVGS